MNQNRKSLSLLWLVNLAFTLGIAFGCESLKEWVRDRVGHAKYLCSIEGYNGFGE